MGKTTDEAMARIEHKVDVTLDFVMEMVGRIYGIRANKVPKMGDGSHQCPVCKEYVKYLVDMQDKSVTRQCACKTGKFAPLDLEQFAPPMAAGGKNGQDARDRDEAAEGDDAPGGRRKPQGSRSR